jgi:hypothetical protein
MMRFVFRILNEYIPLYGKYYILPVFYLDT